jgi:lipopolysaccharide/colanic/teichoic acid biosynthesis glycosyltransferase
VALFEESVYRHTYRHRVKSGITGWARRSTSSGGTPPYREEQVLFDNYYIENWSFWLDIRIILLTLFKSGISAAERSSTTKRSSTPQG